MNQGEGAISFAAEEYWLLHEHADHPDFKCVVTAEYIGDDEGRFMWGCADGTSVAMTDRERAMFSRESHALIYTDGYVAVTMYECCFAFWYLRRGELAGGCLWTKGEWRLSAESVGKIRRVHAALR